MSNLSELNWLKERNCILVLAILFAVLSILVASVPYDPSTDKADATTNDIWIEYYGHGIYHIPYDEWTYGNTQSVVVVHDGEYVVVNEKGPGHVMAILPFRAIGAELLFGPAMAGLAILGTYMLGKRLLGWQTGFIASLLVLFNLTVIVMWHRYYWTDASTMHFTALAFWFLVEGNYRYNGRSLDPRKAEDASNQDRYLGIGITVLSGLAFGAAVSTRYPTGLLAIAFGIYLLGFYLLRVWPDLRKKDVKATVKRGMPFLILLGAFILGLMFILVPLTQYNSEYFGGPFNSGYDATKLMDFNRTGELDIRNTTSIWTSNIGSYVSTAFANLFKLMPTFIARMPALIFLPLGIYCLRKKKLELATLMLWIGINSFTYLSLEWVDMYARTQLVPWEPRYWMPSLPAIAILGGLGIYRLGNWFAKKTAGHFKWGEHDRRVAKLLTVGIIVGILVLWTAVPAASYLQNSEVREGNQPHVNPQAIVVTTDQLLANPQDYVGKAVILNDVIIIGKSFQMLRVTSVNSTIQDTISVQFIDWPVGTIPDFSIGQHVLIRGMFNQKQTPPGAPPIYNLGVKYGTQDVVRMIP
ncbi:MAG: hypothetical protein KKH41_00960 [Candidatus Thermoplasmatota archaeon]|nr:hypothetical protein [Candidatus Thermoplasmatota archaeon]MBU4145180.1 hypothetical protein [Candidatus Thermoplasmatota archaeon]MBU4591131.1 hypothetical protein [Candidatus Thermoplasmatota archaeon]